METFIILLPALMEHSIAFLAIFLSVWFYTSGRKSETRAAVLLEKVKNEVGQLRSINDNILKKAMGDIGDIARNQITQQQTLPTVSGQISNLDASQAQDRTGASTEDGEIILEGHGIPHLPDPLTARQLKYEFTAGFVTIVNAYGWINHYGQNAFLDYVNSKNRAVHGVLHTEYIQNLNQSKIVFEGLCEVIEVIKANHPDLFGNPASVSLYQNTLTRHREGLRNYQEFQRFFHVGDDLNFYEWPAEEVVG